MSQSSDNLGRVLWHRRVDQPGAVHQRSCQAASGSGPRWDQQLSAANGDLLLAPIRRALAAHLPFPPRIEVSILGDAAVLTGALAIGLTAASSTRSHSAHKLLAWGG